MPKNRAKSEKRDLTTNLIFQIINNKENQLTVPMLNSVNFCVYLLFTLNNRYDALGDLLPFVQFKKREKVPNDKPNTSRITQKMPAFTTVIIFLMLNINTLQWA